eukprot:GHVN01044845.1.p1 GENE.GHVN01044845.1~~GHVN01044845.1.p1  ORF type:complete len:248 (-),score=59.44 GHVN01044845.1:136-813(-)
MGNVVSVNCFDRWGRRYPDGPLIKSKTVSTSASSSSAANTGSLTPCARQKVAATSAGTTPPFTGRTNRRRPTAQAGRSARKAASDTEAALTEGNDDEDEQQESSDDDAVANTMKKELEGLKKKLSQPAMMKNNFLNVSVKVTTDESGSQLEWYKCKEGTLIQEDKKPTGTAPISKIVKTQGAVGNANSVQIILPEGTQTFTFKTQKAAQAWQEALQLLITLKAMA